VREYAAKLVILDLADEGRAPTEARHPHDGIRRRAAGHFHGRSHGVVDRSGLRLIDQLHRALAHLLLGQEIIFGACNDIDNRVADAEDVESR
jgi:hypothetical protein